MKIIDLSHPIHPDIPVYPGTEAPRITPANCIERDGFAEVRIDMYSHTATHIDAPCHIVAGAGSLDQYPAEYFIGPALSLDLTGLETAKIGIEALEPHTEQLGKVAFLLLQTGWSSRWGEPGYFQDFPHLSVEAAEWLTRFPLRGVGIDTISVDPVDSAELPAHRHLLGAGMIIIENLANLRALPPRGFNFSCLPLPIRAADGSPVRAVALLDC